MVYKRDIRFQEDLLSYMKMVIIHAENVHFLRKGSTKIHKGTLMRQGRPIPVPLLS